MQKDFLRVHTFRALLRSHSSKKPRCAAESNVDHLLSGTVLKYEAVQLTDW